MLSELAPLRNGHERGEASPPSPCPADRASCYVSCIVSADTIVTNQPVLVGRDKDKSEISKFDGELDDLAVFQAALSADDIAHAWELGGMVGRGASLTLALESDLLSTLEPESAYSAFNLNPYRLSQMLGFLGGGEGSRGVPAVGVQVDI